MPAFLDALGPRAERIGLATLVVLGFGLYLPLGVVTSRREPLVPDLPLDHALPLVPELVVVYALLYPVVLLPLAVRTGRALFRRVAAAYLTIMAVSYAAFVALPVHMTIRPEIPAPSTASTWMLALLYWIDEPSNCFPSLHVSSVLLAGLCTWSADRRVGVLALVLGVGISASTMLVKQHWFADVAAGAVLALVVWWLLVRGTEPEPGPPRRAPIAVLAGAYAALLAILYGLYRAGWEPWT